MIRGLTIALVALVLLFTASVKAETTNGLSDVEIQGRQLARELCDSQPTENFTNTGILQIRDASGNRTNVSMKCSVIAAAENWQSVYESTRTNISERYSPSISSDKLSITHIERQPNEYKLETSYGPAITLPDNHQTTNGEAILENPIHIRTFVFQPSGNKLIDSFAGSDFWLCDLGLEFFHWPNQKVLPKTTNLKRGRAYTLLESTNPNPSTNGYSRVVSWIDQETGGILEAEAYDTKGKLLKVFEPKSFKKVNGQWELQEMEIRNVQTGSRTRIEFDLKK